MTEEVWAPLPGFERYEVSTLGRVRSLQTGYILSYKPKSDSGYVVVGLATDEGQRTMRLHGLVARAFMPNTDPTRWQLNHKDGDRTNNAVSNLEWVTPKENRQHAKARGTSKAATNPNFQFKLSPDDVALIQERYAAGASLNGLGREFGVNRGHIRRIVRGQLRATDLPAVRLDERERCALIVESYARGCVSNHLCASMARDIRSQAKQDRSPEDV